MFCTWVWVWCFCGSIVTGSADCCRCWARCHYNSSQSEWTQLFKPKDDCMFSWKMLCFMDLLSFDAFESILFWWKLNVYTNLFYFSLSAVFGWHAEQECNALYAGNSPVCLSNSEFPNRLLIADVMNRPNIRCDSVQEKWSSQMSDWKTKSDYCHLFLAGGET
jgi:hypothetical protein